MLENAQRFLCISSYEEGQDFLRQCAEMGVRPTLLTVDRLRNGDWPREALEELVTMPEGLTQEQILNTVSWMMRGWQFDRVIALDEFDQEAAAAVREHARIPGMGVTTSAYYRDKLAMLTSASQDGFLVPKFCRVFNYDELRAYMAEVKPPWLLKPRAEISALGIRRIEDAEELWRALDELGDMQSRYVLEQIVPGEIFHVDAILNDGKVVFQAAHQYGKSPTQGMREGGVFSTRTVDRKSGEWQELTKLNARLAPSMGLARGVTHAAYVKAEADGRFYFLEIAARVGGRLISDLVEVATGVNLWREWAKVEVTNLRGEVYAAPKAREQYAGSVLCLATTAEPDMSAFDAPEIVVRMKQDHHAGLIVRSADAERVRTLVEEYSVAFAERFLARTSPSQ
ncbi:MAG TPA: ATP-grasp domain-containing protein [Terracidiphilus sp.]|nr:ATP-grasp domain-containing protein [Terracidiphilus sp.]